MKMRILLGLIIFSFPSITWAQVSKELYENAIDFVNCKSVELSLYGRAELEKFKQNYPCENADYEQINSFLVSAGVFKTITLSKEIEGLKGKYNEAWDEENVIAFLTDSIFSHKTKYPAIFGFSEIREGNQILIDYKESLKSGLSYILEESFFSNDATDVDFNIDQPAEIAVVSMDKNSQEVETGSWFSSMTLQIVMISFLVSLVCSLLVKVFAGKLRRKSDDAVPEKIKNYVKEKTQNLVYSSPSTNSSGELRKLKEEFEQIKEEMKYLRLKSIPMEVIPPKDEIALHQVIKELEIKPEIFFTSTPNEDGSFNESSTSSAYKEGASIYRFIKTGNNTAQYHIEEREASVKLAIQYPELRIDPLCDAENAFNPIATRILTVQPGEAELQGDKWVRNIKAKIRYES